VGSKLYQVTAGGAVFFVSQALPPETGAVPNGRAAGVFVSGRGSTGWSTRDLTPFAASDPSSIGGSLLIAGSADGSSALIDTAATLVAEDQDNPTNLASSAGGEGVAFDLYLVREGQGAKLVSKGTLPRTPPPAASQGIRPPFVFSATLSAVGFVSNAPLDPAASATAADCYKWADVGQLAALTNRDNGASANCRLLGMTPDGRPVMEDTSGDSYAGLLFVLGREFPGATSGASSVQISGPTPNAATFDALSPGGETAYVTTTDKLIPEAEVDTRADLYGVAVPRFSKPFEGPPSASSVTCVSCGHNGAGATFVGQSAAGTHVYFSTSEGLWSWDARSHVASELTTATDVSQVVSSENGQYIIGLTAQLANNPNGTGDVYEFAASQSPLLITSGASADTYLLDGIFGGNSSFPTTGGVSNDGARIVYDRHPASGAPGVIDEWIAGRTKQISPADSTHPYFVLGTAGEGLQDIFFMANDPLVPQDLNAGTTDIYNARVNGGFPAPSEPANNSQTPNPVGPTTPPYTGSLEPSGLQIAPLPPDTSRPASVTKPLTRAQKLARALKACKKDKSKSKRRKCEKEARRKYAPRAKVTKLLEAHVFVK
jgi:hypothetical protein